MQNSHKINIILIAFVWSVHFIEPSKKGEEKMVQNVQTEPVGVTRSGI